MVSITKALDKYKSERDIEVFDYIKLESKSILTSTPASVKFVMQSDVKSKGGIDGAQASDMLHYLKCLFEELNEEQTCRQNIITIEKLEEAIYWQDARTKDRERRGVEGFDAF